MVDPLLSLSISASVVLSCMAPKTPSLARISTRSATVEKSSRRFFVSRASDLKVRTMRSKASANIFVVSPFSRSGFATPMKVSPLSQASVAYQMTSPPRDGSRSDSPKLSLMLSISFASSVP